MKVQITLKSGVQIDFRAKEITRTFNKVTNEFTGLKWENDGPGPNLFYIRVEEVAAIVTDDREDTQ